MSTSVDRRVVRTRTALREALLSMLRRKNYEEISVQDIIDAAGVGRSTFYMHCSSKEDLLRRGLRMLRAEIEEGVSEHGRSGALSFSRKLLEHVAANRDVCAGLGRSRGREVLLHELRAIALDLLRKDLVCLSGNAAMPQEMVEQFIVGAFMSVLVWSVERKRPPMEVDAMFQRLVLGCLQCAHAEPNPSHGPRAVTSLS